MSTALDYKHYFSEEDEREYWGREAAGCIFIAKDTGRILIGHRNDSSPDPQYGLPDQPGTWGTWGGKVDAYETPKDAVEREIAEETGYEEDYKLAHLYTFRSKDANGQDFKYHNYVVLVPFEFMPELNWENDTSKWVEYGEWPRPMHFGLEELIRHAGTKIKKIVALIKKKIKKREIGEFWRSRPNPGPPKKSVLMNEGGVTILRQGLVDDGVYGYEMKSSHSYLRYEYEPARKTFYLRNIGTPNPEDRNKGYARDLLESFFQLIKQYGGALDSAAYTTSGMAYIKHVVERFSRKYNVPLVKGREIYDQP